jgi:hypothetical protein
MRNAFEKESFDTGPYQEWLAIVGSLTVAALIGAALFASGVLS